MTMLSSIRRAFVLVLLCSTLTVAYAADTRCDFATRRLGGAAGLGIAFGSLDPSSGATVTIPVMAASINGGSIGDCVSSLTMTLAGDAGARLLRHTTLPDTISYSLVGLPISQSGPGNSKYVSFTFNGTVTGAAYANAPAGFYSDNVVISVTP